MYYVLSLAGLGGIWVISKPSAFLNFCWLNMLAPTSGAVMLVHSNLWTPACKIMEWGNSTRFCLWSITESICLSTITRC